jgi:hypothetical protein
MHERLTRSNRMIWRAPKGLGHAAILPERLRKEPSRTAGCAIALIAHAFFGKSFPFVT